MHLAFHDHRVDDPAHVVHGDHANNLDRAGVLVDLHLADMAAAGIGEVLRVVERGLVEAGFKLLDRVVVRHVGGERHLAQRFRLIGTGDGELAVLELDVIERGFHQMGGDLLALGDHLVHRLDHRGAADRQAATAVGAHAERDLGRVAVHHIHLVDRHAELVGNELRERRLVALAVAVRAGEHRHAAGRVDADFRHFVEAGAGTQRSHDLAGGRCRRPRRRWRCRCRAACPSPPPSPAGPGSRPSRRPAAPSSGSRSSRRCRIRAPPAFDRGRRRGG